MYTLAGDQLSEKKTFDVSGAISDVVYSPDGQSLAVTSAKIITIYDSASYQVMEEACLLLILGIDSD